MIDNKKYKRKNEQESLNAAHSVPFWSPVGTSALLRTQQWLSALIWQTWNNCDSSCDNHMTICLIIPPTISALLCHSQDLGPVSTSATAKCCSLSVSACSRLWLSLVSVHCFFSSYCFTFGPIYYPIYLWLFLCSSCKRRIWWYIWFSTIQYGTPFLLKVLGIVRDCFSWMQSSADTYQYLSLVALWRQSQRIQASTSVLWEFTHPGEGYLRGNKPKICLQSQIDRMTIMITSVL